MLLTVEQIQSVIRERIPSGLVVPEHTDEGHFYRATDLNLVYPSVTTKSGILDMPHLKKWAARLAVDHIDKNWNIITPDNKADIFKAAIMAHEDELDDAGGVGTEGHGVIERYLNSWMDTLVRPADITKFIVGEDIRLHAITRSAQQFCIDFNVIPIASEKFVMSHRHRFGGTLDSLMMVARPVNKPRHSCQTHQFWGTTSPKNWNQLFCSKCGMELVLEFSIVDWKTSNSIDKVEYAMQVAAYFYALWEMTGLRPKHLLIVRLDKEVAKYQVMRVVNRIEAFRAFNHCGKVYDWLNNGKEKLAPLNAKERITLSMLADA